MVLAVPHTLWGWQVQQHVPAAYLRPQMALAAGWWFFALSVSLGLWTWDVVADWRARRRPTPVDPGRRRLLSGVPLALGLAAPAGVVEGAQEPEPRTIRVASPHLPPGLEGFRILQISDLHLGPVLGLDWLDRALDRKGSLPLDLVAVTGDLVDGRLQPPEKAAELFEISIHR